MASGIAISRVALEMDRRGRAPAAGPAPGGTAGSYNRDGPLRWIRQWIKDGRHRVGEQARAERDGRTGSSGRTRDAPAIKYDPVTLSPGLIAQSQLVRAPVKYR